MLQTSWLFVVLHLVSTSPDVLVLLLLLVGIVLHLLVLVLVLERHGLLHVYNLLLVLVLEQHKHLVCLVCLVCGKLHVGLVLGCLSLVQHFLAQAQLQLKQLLLARSGVEKTAALCFTTQETRLLG